MQFDQKNYREAANLYAKALDVRPESLTCARILAALFYDNRFDEAIAQFKDTLARNPNHPQALFNIGIALVHRKNDLRMRFSIGRSWSKRIQLSRDQYREEQIRIVKRTAEQEVKRSHKQTSTDTRRSRRY